MKLRLASCSTVLIFSAVIFVGVTFFQSIRLNPASTYVGTAQQTKESSNPATSIVTSDDGAATTVVVTYFDEVLGADGVPTQLYASLLRTHKSLPRPRIDIAIVPQASSQRARCYAAAGLVVGRALTRLPYQKPWVYSSAKSLVRHAARTIMPGPRPTPVYRPNIQGAKALLLLGPAVTEDDRRVYSSHGFPQPRSIPVSPKDRTGTSPSAPESAAAPCTIIALGNMPLGPCEPSIASLRSAEAAAAQYRSHAGRCRIVFTGRPHPDGGLAEAEFMALVAEYLGVPASAVLLEASAASTRQNAALSYALLQRTYKSDPSRAGRSLEEWLGDVYIVSKQEHLEWALPMFAAVPGFRGVPLHGVPADITMQEVVQEFQRYLKYEESEWVNMRLQDVLAGKRGID